MGESFAQFRQDFGEFKNKYPDLTRYLPTIKAAFIDHCGQQEYLSTNCVRIFTHVRSCSKCWERVKSYQHTMSAYADQPDIDKYKTHQ